MTWSGARFPAPDDRPAETAAAWLARREGGRMTREDEARFRHWLSMDAAHDDAYEAAVEALQAAGRHAAAPEIVALREAALAMPAHRRSSPWPIAAAAALVLAFGLGWSLVSGPDAATSPARIAEALTASHRPEHALYRTAVGERLTFTLPDGSVTTLNTNSELKVDYREGERRVKLLRGQALFQVAKNPNLPFRVYAGDRRITALGTEFDVRLEGARVKVSLIEGSVRVAQVKPRSSQVLPTEQVVMTAGEILEAAPASPMRVKIADPVQAASWRSGVVVFEDEPLSSAVAEINRYTNRPVALGDASAGAYRVSGVFKTGEPERFAATMAEIFPLEVDHAPDGAATLRRKN